MKDKQVVSESRKIAGQSIHPVGLGCMNICYSYGPAIEKKDAIKLLRHALDIGCNFFDTATIYGLGESEKLIGEAIGSRRDDFFLASKCVLGFKDGQRTKDGSPDAIKAACEDSLRRLGTEIIDLYYMHRPDPNVPIEESVGALSELVSEGKIKSIGLSEMGEGLLRRAHAVHPIAAMQSEYSLWVRNPEIAVKAACEELGVALVAFSPVGRGFLADPPADPASFHDTDMRKFAFPRFSEDHYPANLELLGVAKDCAREIGCSVAQLAIAWTLAKGDNILPIPGTKNIQHLEENHAAAYLKLPQDMVARLDAHFTPESASGPRYSPAFQDTVDTEQYDFEHQA